MMNALRREKCRRFFKIAVVQDRALAQTRFQEEKMVTNAGLFRIFSSICLERDRLRAR